MALLTKYMTPLNLFSLTNDHHSLDNDGGSDCSMVSYNIMAHFLHNYPDMERAAVSAIFDKINQSEGQSVQCLLAAYLRLFHFRGVPIDIAMRDTMCSFLS
uniref:SEC7 domain-containing protein n=1 Tax=Lygus hesperus TaxID=30085 RepID=A0A0A9YWC3_LYGHE